MRSLVSALEREARVREVHGKACLAEAEKLREAAQALNHKLVTEPEIVLPDGTRKEQLATIIQQLGGEATRSEINAIAEKSGIPLGTIASLLGSKHHRRLFHEKDGKWSVIQAGSGSTQTVDAELVA